MARKRMLSPDIWESESFSSLSDLSKIVFISIISHADDEGRGKASASHQESALSFGRSRNLTLVANGCAKINSLGQKIEQRPIGFSKS